MSLELHWFEQCTLQCLEGRRFDLSNTLFPRKPKKPVEIEMESGESESTDDDVALYPEEPEPVSAILYVYIIFTNTVSG